MGVGGPAVGGGDGRGGVGWGWGGQVRGHMGHVESFLGQVGIGMSVGA